MSAQPLAVSVSPVVVTLPPGTRHWNGHITVRNVGTKPVTVYSSAQLIRSTSHGCTPVHAASWMKVAPASVQLAPGHSESMAVTLSEPATATGTIDTAAIFTAVGKKGDVTVEGSVGSQVITTSSTASGASPAIHCATATHHHLAAPASGSGGIPTAALAGGVLGVLLLAVAVITLITRRNRREGRHAG